MTGIPDDNFFSLIGWKIVSLPGSVVRATAEGTILYASGEKVIIDHGNNLKTSYENFKALNTKVGNRIQKGDSIGCLGEEGIFYQIKRFNKELDPANYIDDDLLASK